MSRFGCHGSVYDCFMFITRPGRPYKRLSLIRRHVAGGTYKQQQQQRSDDDSLQGEKRKREIRITALTLRSLLQDRFITVTILQGTWNRKKNCLTKKLPKAELKMAAACTNTHSVYHFGDTAGLIWPANLCVCVTSLPPTALVRITAEETGGGMQLTVCNLGNHNNHRVKKKEEDEDETDLSHCLPPQRKLWGWRNVFHKWEKQNKTMQYDVTQTGLQVGGACVRLRWPY